ncbi:MULTISPECIES: DUF6498-containing protein [Halorussus]|uniref:DUF6498-containing protein n=1 Tax=Halorussus TaxID=1070314 RepID=UPI00209E735F|nr:DUF6498-containing protein [Halorussus vallis]USZ75895.1 DUF6498-containing protein [Halorussus vallis]
MVVERRGSSPFAVGALVVANFVPLVGVLWWGWSVFEVLVLYWVESGVVGAYNVPKILLAAGDDFGVDGEVDDFGVAPGADGRTGGAGEAGEATDGRRTSPSVAWQAGDLPSWLTEAGGRADNLGVAAFFVLHYGIFWVVHGVFVFALPLFAWGFGLGAGTTVTPGGPFAPVGAFGWGFRPPGLAFGVDFGGA